jgi:hypothetical protein
VAVGVGTFALEVHQNFEAVFNNEEPIGKTGALESTLHEKDVVWVVLCQENRRMDDRLR